MRPARGCLAAGIVLGALWLIALEPPIPVPEWVQVLLAAAGCIAVIRRKPGAG